MKDTKDPRYATRLSHLSGARWKRALDVQRPYRWNLRRLNLGKTLDVGCGIGRNLVSLPAGSVGVDHNADCVHACTELGLKAYLPEALPPGTFDSLLFAHVIEHLNEPDAITLVRTYLPRINPGGTVVFITPQEAGYKTDSTHIRFTDFTTLRDLARACNLQTLSEYSFPFPRVVGKVFAYNEFVLIAKVIS